MNSNVVSIFRDGRAPRTGFNPSWQPEPTCSERVGQTGAVEADYSMIDLSGLSDAEWDEVFGGSFIIF